MSALGQKRTSIAPERNRFTRSYPSSTCRLCGGRPLGVDHEIARDWHRITLGRKQQLKHHVRTVKEFEFDGSEIEFPHPTEPFVIDRRRTGTIFGEALAPMFNRVMIMQP